MGRRETNTRKWPSASLPPDVVVFVIGDGEFVSARARLGRGEGGGVAPSVPKSGPRERGKRGSENKNEITTAVRRGVVTVNRISSDRLGRP